MSLELRNITKHFGPVLANNNVSLEIQAGEIHGLLGENGAGKSTLVKILSGFLTSDDGEIELDSNVLHLSSPYDAVNAGIGILHQEPLVFLPFTLVDNFLAGSPKKFKFNRKSVRLAIEQISKEFGFDFDTNSIASELTIGERQQLEISRLLWLGARILILDEPTTAISSNQRIRLFETIKKLADAGMSVIFVSHKLEEIQSICDKVTILRKGELVGTRDLPCDSSELVELMFDKSIGSQLEFNTKTGKSKLVLKNIASRESNSTITNVDCEILEGEIVGIAGLEGAGQRVLLRAIVGLSNCHEGDIEFAGNFITNMPYEKRIKNGFYYLPSDREQEGLISGFTIAEHFALNFANKKKTLNWASIRTYSRLMIEKYSIKGTIDSTPESLSGGNQQRLLLALMPDELSVILMEHPTRGLDMESASWVWEQLLTRTRFGTSIIYSSSDLDELMIYSDRILVCFSGKIVGVVNANQTNTEEIGLMMSGVLS
jgi:simple sugar transport system ATP-binding protein